MSETTDPKPQPRFLNSGETVILRDIVVKMLAKQLGTDDGNIIDELIAKRDPSDGTLQHIVDETSNLQLPKPHTDLLQKIKLKLQLGQ